MTVVCNLCTYFKPRIFEDTLPSEDNLTDTCQPFLMQTGEGGCFRQQMAREAGTWASIANPEQTAFALAQVTAAHILPPLVPLECGTDLLGYCVQLRDQMDGALVDELAMVLKTSWRELGWEQVGTATYLCVIGAGVAACLDMTRAELGLRYNTELEHALFLAGRTLDLPRSRLFLQSNLYERFDALLTRVRTRTWNWMID